MAQEYPTKGDLFVCDNEDSLTVVSLNGGRVNFSLLRKKGENRGRISLQLRIDSSVNTQRQLFVQHYGKSYELMRKDDPEYNNRKPVDEVQDVVADFDARHFVKVGDKLRYSAMWDCSWVKPATVTKVSKCYVTYREADGRGGRGKATRWDNAVRIGANSSCTSYMKDITEELDLLGFALAHTDHMGFLIYFIEQSKPVYENYIRLATENGSLAYFEANPLAFIISNQPACCYNIAVDYIKSRQ